MNEIRSLIVPCRAGMKDETKNLTIVLDKMTGTCKYCGRVVNENQFHLQAEQTIPGNLKNKSEASGIYFYTCPCQNEHEIKTQHN